MKKESVDGRSKDLMSGLQKDCYPLLYAGVPMVQRNNKIPQMSCENTHLVNDSEAGEIICSDCGLVISEKIEDSGREWRSFLGEEKDRRRGGPGLSLAKHDKGLATVIGLKNEDFSGKSLSIPMKYNFNRLRIWDGRIYSHGRAEKSFIHAFNELYLLRDKLALSEAIVEKSAYLIRKAKAKNLMKGRRLKSLAASCVYAACRQGGVMRTLNDIVKASDIHRKEIASCYRFLVKELGLEMPVIDPINCVSRISCNIGSSEKANRFAIEIIRRAKKGEFLAGKHPMGLAAAALYISCNKMSEHYSQIKIGESADVTSVTVRNIAKELKKVLSL